MLAFPRRGGGRRRGGFANLWRLLTVCACASLLSSVVRGGRKLRSVSALFGDHAIAGGEEYLMAEGDAVARVRRTKRNFTEIALSSEFEDEYVLTGKFEAWNVLVFRGNGMCDIIEEYTANAARTLAQSARQQYGNGTSRDAPSAKTKNGRGVLIKVEHPCQSLFNHPSYGQGNWITTFYMNRLNAELAGVDFMARCTDGKEKARDLILPWIMGFWPSKGGAGMGGSGTPGGNGTGTAAGSRGHLPPFPWPYPRPPLAAVSLPSSERCIKSDAALHLMIPHIIHDLRRMAVAVAGVPPPSHPTSSAVSTWAERYLYSPRTSPLRAGPDVPQLPLPPEGHPPLFPLLGQDLDDAALHFRCGDLMGTAHPAFGFMNFDAYARHLLPSAASIGIITTPFGTQGQIRQGAEGKDRVRYACRRVVEEFQVYLRERFPDASVTIRNGPEETVVTSYARLILANQTVVGMGSFGVFPALATFGTGYVRKPDFVKVANHWVKGVSEMYDHVKVFEAKERLMAATATKWQRADNWDEMFGFFRGKGGSA